ncbi:adenine/guanine permease AZG2 [Cinnamomum micranthum f. kanehirae]|uniref:Adenine/guanine permease AZG2 n=1 Tax=Cinnamomum micranthum f. kanehirae TaxID=337451 RepID=A0A443Q1T2_9MAGN|nr:adenine/guanine permease AZG2 [Cinnamomum micranthum f. kanehirae]
MACGYLHQCHNIDSGGTCTLSDCAVANMSIPTHQSLCMATVRFLITSYSLMKKIKGSMIYGIMFVTLISWIRVTSVTFFPNTPLGGTNYKYLKKVLVFQDIKTTAGALSFSNFNRTVLGTSGHCIPWLNLQGSSMKMAGLKVNGYLAFIVDARTAIIGSMLWPQL